MLLPVRFGTPQEMPVIQVDNKARLVITDPSALTAARCFVKDRFALVRARDLGLYSQRNLRGAVSTVTSRPGPVKIRIVK